MSRSLLGKRLVVTGGATGIGFSVARLAAERGARVVLSGRTEAKLKAAAALIGDAATFEVLDVVDGSAVDRVFASIGAFDHLITCAAGVLAGHFSELDEADVRDFIETKFWGQYRSVKVALPQLANDGSVVLLSGLCTASPSRTCRRSRR